jgi:hypothetical protein
MGLKDAAAKGSHYLQAGNSVRTFLVNHGTEERKTLLSVTDVSTFLHRK